MHIAVIGAGIVGVCTAAWLQRDGHEISIVDPREAGTACSFGNGGSLSPSACLPVGMPGIWRQVPRWLRDPLGPLTIRPAYLPRVLPWILALLRHSRPAEVERIARALRGLLAPIFEAYAPLVERAGADALIRRSGCLYVYGSKEAAARSRWGMDLRRSLGVTLHELDADALAALEPDLGHRFHCGILAPDNGSTPDPQALVAAIHDRCVADGAHRIRRVVEGLIRQRDRVTALRLAGGEQQAVDGVVICAGAWSGALVRHLGLRIPLETQRGYHVTVGSSNLQLRHTVMAVERNLIINPMAMGLRLAGTVEFAGLSAPADERRAQALLAHGRLLFPHLDISRHTTWMGHRPCLPDSLPVIGAAPRTANVWLAFGHGHVGMCGAAVTGREIAHCIAGRPGEIDLFPFRADRFA